MGASDINVVEGFHVSKGTVSKIYTKYRKSGKLFSAKSQRGRKCVMDDRDRLSLKRIVTKNKNTRAANVTAELNDGLSKPISTKTIRRELHKKRFLGQTAIPKALISDANASMRKMG